MWSTSQAVATLPFGGADLHFFSPQPNASLHCKIMGLVHHAVCLFSVLAFVCIHWAYSRRDGQAELTWVASYIPRWFTHLQMVTHPRTNRVRCWLTSLMRLRMLSTKLNGNIPGNNWVSSMVWAPTTQASTSTHTSSTHWVPDHDTQHRILSTPPR